MLFQFWNLTPMQNRIIEIARVNKPSNIIYLQVAIVVYFNFTHLELKLSSILFHFQQFLYSSGHKSFIWRHKGMLWI
jgi:hypothetical protein